MCRAVVQAQTRADVITFKKVLGDTLYLVRLREDWDSLTSFHLKKLSEFEALDRCLRDTASSRPWGEAQIITILPELPPQGTFGVRAQLSKIGMSCFLDRQHEDIQHYLDVLLAQVPNIAADSSLQGFFSSTRTQQDDELLMRMLVEARAGIGLQTLVGTWQQKGLGCTWTIDEAGKALLDGRRRGNQYDLLEQGGSVQLTISRLDGWKVDVEKSTTRHLFWRMPGETEMEWTRVEEAEEQACISVDVTAQCAER